MSGFFSSSEKRSVSVSDSINLLMEDHSSLQFGTHKNAQMKSETRSNWEQYWSLVSGVPPVSKRSSGPFYRSNGETNKASQLLWNSTTTANPMVTKG